MTNVTAKIKIKGKNFEILVDANKAVEVKKGKASANEALINDVVFYNIKSGEKASEKDLLAIFGTDDVYVISEKIIKQGEIEIPSEFISKEKQEKLKQVVEFLVKNSVNPGSGLPYSPKRIEESLKEAGGNIENKPIEEQIPRILEKLRVVLPIKIETKKLKIVVPAVHTGKAYGLLNEHKEKEDWLDNGDLKVIINIPAGMQMDFYDKLNSITHGSAVVEEIKEG